VCGRYVAQDPISEIAKYLGVDEVTVAEDRPPSWNVAPSQPVVAVATSRDGRTRRLGELRWGLVPSWAKNPSIGSRLINARAETVASLPAFARAFERRRCLIPASGYYEWQKRYEPGLKKPKRQAFYLRPPDESIIAFGAIWEVWRDAAGQPIRSCSIITTSANQALASIHDRMPVILPATVWDQWLAPERLSADDAHQMLIPAPDGLLAPMAVSDRVNSPHHDGPELLDPWLPG
jgi:putative SOS response-associated peptidase YedK